MKEKIVNLMKSEGLTSSRLAEILEIQPSGISHIVSGRNKPGFDLLQKILRRFPQINPDWLLLDSPTMYRDQVEGGQSSQASQREFDSSHDSSIDLFGFGAELSPTAAAQNDPISSLKNDLFSPGNFGENLGQKSASNSIQNPTQNRQNFSTNSPRVQRIIILYSDGTFSSYNPQL